MSYILDALNKAERERRLGQVPLLGGTLTTIRPDRRRWYGIIGGGLLMLSGAGFGWLGLTLWPASPAPSHSSAVTRDTVPRPQVVIADHPLTVSRPMPYAQLPITLRQTLGPLNLDIHVYSAQPSQRFVVINDQRYRQGDWLQAGLLLEQITPDGVILSDRGHRFTLSATP